MWALVTGASTGLGREFARALARLGYSVVLVARDRAALSLLASALEKEAGVATEVLVADLLDQTARAAVAERLASTTHPIDIFVSNAGFGLSGDLHQTAWPEERDHLDIHVSVPLELTHSALRAMHSRRRGRIIVVASVAAFLHRGAYSAAKRYWISMAKSLTATYRKSNVTVTAVCPGFTRTEFHQRMAMDVSGLPGWAWLAADRVVATGLRHALRGKPVSVPSLRYRTLVALAPLIPTSLHQVGSARRAS